MTYPPNDIAPKRHPCFLIMCERREKAAPDQVSPFLVVVVE